MRQFGGELLERVMNRRLDHLPEHLGRLAEPESMLAERIGQGRRSAVAGDGEHELMLGLEGVAKVVVDAAPRAPRCSCAAGPPGDDLAPAARVRIPS